MRDRRSVGGGIRRINSIGRNVNSIEEDNVADINFQQPVERTVCNDTMQPMRTFFLKHNDSLTPLHTALSPTSETIRT